jgi:hypothetical protein
MTRAPYHTKDGKRVALGKPINTGPIKRKRKVNGAFVKLPRAWATKLAEMGASGSTYAVAIEILWRTWRNRGKAIVLPRIEHVSRGGRRIALQALEGAGLVVIERRPDKSPSVTARHVD